MAGFDAHDRVGLRVEGGIPPEHLDGDGVGLDTIAAAGQRFFDDIAEETPLASGSFEVGALQDTVELGTAVSRRETIIPCRGYFRLAHRTSPSFLLRLCLSRLLQLSHHVTYMAPLAPAIHCA